MFQLPEEDQLLLLGIARNAVESHLRQSSPKPAELSQGIVLEPHGVFVSIHVGEQLRGCVGNVMPEQPLHQAAARCAVAAATSDTRFPPVTLAELPYVSFELSVLSIPEPVQNVDKIEVGRHGLIVTKGAARGLLLPQVATQCRWNRNQFLAETCIKAGLPPNAWTEGASMYCFTAAVFGEEHIPHRATS